MLISAGWFPLVLCILVSLWYCLHSRLRGTSVQLVVLREKVVLS